jgi:predicted component of type VI protein secretion system
VLCEPLAVLVPLQSPEAVQLVTPLLVQLSVALWPDCTLDALAVSVTLGATASPERSTVEAPPTPSCAIESDALFTPTPAVGLNFTEIVQLPVVAAIELPQVFV